MSWFDSKKLHEGLSCIGISLSGTQEEALRRFGEEVIEVNRVMNLTRVPEEEFITRHFLDSLSIASAIDLRKVATLIDIGTGAGFPGVPIAIAWPHIDVTVLDSTMKKVNFVKEAASKIGIKIKAVHGRAEELSRKENYRENYREKNYREKFDVATSRAISSLRTVVELSSPFVKKGGMVAAWKGGKAIEELKEAEPALEGLMLDTPTLTKNPVLTDSYLVIFRKKDLLPATRQD